jgi:hypothetical protein
VLSLTIKTNRKPNITHNIFYNSESIQNLKKHHFGAARPFVGLIGA